MSGTGCHRAWCYDTIKAREQDARVTIGQDWAPLGHFLALPRLTQAPERPWVLNGIEEKILNCIFEAPPLRGQKGVGATVTQVVSHEQTWRGEEAETRSPELPRASGMTLEQLGSMPIGKPGQQPYSFLRFRDDAETESDS